MQMRHYQWMFVIMRNEFIDKMADMFDMKLLFIKFYHLLLNAQKVQGKKEKLSPSFPATRN